MKIVMTMLVRNESDIIEHNIAFHAAMGVDHFIIMDHCSNDDTCQIIDRLSRVYSIELLKQESSGYYQSDWVSSMARHATINHDADWIINNDADEFWWPMHGNLKDAIDSVQDSLDGLYIQRFNYPPISGSQSDTYLERMIYIDLLSTNSFGKPLPPKLCHKSCFDVTVSQGNHDAHGSTISKKGASTVMQILHFPMRSWCQFSAKISMGGKAYELSPEIPSGIGGTWRQLYELYKKGELTRYYESQCLQVDQDELLPQDALRWKRDTRLRDFIRGLNYIP
jgi:hypothetical protein